MSEQRDNSSVLGTPTRPPVNTPVAKSHDDLNEIPTEICPLPSNGKVYPVNSTLYNRDVVEIKSMTTVEENILTSQALAKKGTMLTSLIKSCLIDKSVDPADLLVGDRLAILLAIRITGYGHIYTDTVVCSECEASTTRTFDMSRFPLKRLTIDPVAPGQNLFAFTLPRTKKVVEFKFLTGRDEEEIHVTEARQKKLGMIAGNENVTSSLIRSIMSVNGITDGGKIANFVQHLNAFDSLALRQYMGQHQPGMKFEQEQTCSACGHVEEVDMPMGLGFLWPNAKR